MIVFLTLASTAPSPSPFTLSVQAPVMSGHCQLVPATATCLYKQNIDNSG